MTTSRGELLARLARCEEAVHALEQDILEGSVLRAGLAERDRREIHLRDVDPRIARNRHRDGAVALSSQGVDGPGGRATGGDSSPRAAPQGGRQ